MTFYIIYVTVCFLFSSGNLINAENEELGSLKKIISFLIRLLFTFLFLSCMVKWMEIV